MKIKFSWAFIALIFSGLFISCKSDNTTTLLGNWVEDTQFSGAPRSNANTVVINGEAYLFGGDDGDFMNQTWKFIPTTGQWKEMGVFPGAGRRWAVAFVLDGKAYYGLGYDGYYKRKDFWKFDPTKPDSLQWERVADFEGTARYGAVAFVINGEAFVGAGYSDEGANNTFYKYDASSDEWTAVSVPKRKFYFGTAFVIDNKAYVGTGLYNGTYVDEFTSYDPTTDTWTSLKSLTDQDSYTITRSNAVSFTLNGKGYVGLGSNSGIRSDFWEYDPVDDTWIEVTSYEGKARQDAISFVIDGKAYVGTGRNGTSYFDDVWYFEPDVEDNNAD